MRRGGWTRACPAAAAAVAVVAVGGAGAGAGVREGDDARRGLVVRPGRHINVWVWLLTVTTTTTTTMLVVVTVAVVVVVVVRTLTTMDTKPRVQVRKKRQGKRVGNTMGREMKARRRRTVQSVVKTKARGATKISAQGERGGGERRGG